MHKFLNFFDTISGRITMYKSVAWSLMGVVLVGAGLAFAGVVGISGWGLLAVTLVLAVSCYLSNELFSRLLKAPTSSESWLITALILACIIAPDTSLERLGFAALAGVIAMASKYFITWNGSHFLNPAAFGAFVLSASGSLPAVWWIATPWMLLMTVPIALVQLRRHRQFAAFFTFAGVALAVMLLVQDGPVGQLLYDGLVLYPIIFLGSIMLTEPITRPSGKQYQLLYALIVGALFSAQLDLGPVFMSPMLALLAGNIFALIAAPPFGASLQLKQRRQLAPDIIELTFNKPDKLRFKAGQYMDLTLPQASADVRGNRRTFSLTSAPSEDKVIVTVRTYPKGSSFKRALTTLKPGADVRMANIGGEFTLPAGKRPLALVAGGIGITPFRSQIAQLVASKQHRDIVLVYVASSQEHLVYKDLFDAAAASGVKTEYVVGRLHGADLLNLVPDIAERTVMIAGPAAMVNDYKHELVKSGLPRRRVLTDSFNGY